MKETIRVRGYKEFLKACKDADKDTRKFVRDRLRQSGEIVREEASTEFEPYSAKSAAGYRVRVRQRGIAVEQSLRRTTGLHPNWGGYQMRHALLPALEKKEAAVEAELEAALDDVAAHFEA